MFEVAKEFTFEAAHRLHLMNESHRCKSIHGHSYKVVVTLASDRTGADGMILDFHLFEPIKSYIDRYLDHSIMIAEDDKDLISFIDLICTKCLILTIPQTTCELLANYLYWEFYSILGISNNNEAFWIKSVLVSETKKTYAIYTPDEDNLKELR